MANGNNYEQFTDVSSSDSHQQNFISIDFKRVKRQSQYAPPPLIPPPPQPSNPMMINSLGGGKTLRSFVHFSKITL